MIENEMDLAVVEAEEELLIEVVEEKEYMAYFDSNGSC
jgi:hypothetical protein